MSDNPTDEATRAEAEAWRRFPTDLHGQSFAIDIPAYQREAFLGGVEWAREQTAPTEPPASPKAAQRLDTI